MGIGSDFRKMKDLKEQLRDVPDDATITIAMFTMKDKKSIKNIVCWGRPNDLDYSKESNNVEIRKITIVNG
jgi:hypothetical protein